MPIRSTRRTPKTTITPATPPIRIAAQGATNAQAAVIATRAAMAPFSIIDRSGFLITSHEVMTAPRTPAAAARFVFSATYAKKPTPPKSTLSVEPGLKPNQPNQRMITPSVVNAMLWPGMALGFPSCRELADPRPEQERPGEAGERALVVDDGRTGEVLHALREQPAVGAPDPVRDERVDQRVGDAEREVDPQPCAFRHRAPHDRERHGAEDDLEEVSRCGWDRREPAER